MNTSILWSCHCIRLFIWPLFTGLVFKLNHATLEIILFTSSYREDVKTSCFVGSLATGAVCA